MSVKIARYGKEKWIAYDAANGETEGFETYDEAASWLVNECNDEGIAEETERGLSYIAKVTHRTAMDVIDRKEDYHEHNESCPEDCIEEEWPYDSEFDHVGRIYLVEVDADEPKEERGAEPELGDLVACRSQDNAGYLAHRWPGGLAPDCYVVLMRRAEVEAIISRGGI